MIRTPSSFMAGLLALLACACTELGRSPSGEAPGGEGVEIVEPSYVSISPEARLQRASMVLRGYRPSLADYAALAEDPEAYAELVDAYLDSEAFAEMVAQYFTEWMELDQTPDFYPAGFPALGELSGLGTHELNSSVIAAPGQLAAYTDVLLYDS